VQPLRRRRTQPNMPATTDNGSTGRTSSSFIFSPVRSYSFSYYRTMAVGAAGGRHAAEEEARAEVDVLNSRLEKTSQLTKKIEACLGRLESTGKSVREVVAPLNGETRKLQTLGSSTFSSAESTILCPCPPLPCSRQRGFAAPCRNQD